MSKVNYLEPDHAAVEKRHLNRWRVFNGQNWVHGFSDRESAIWFAKKNSGTRVAFCKEVDGKVVYVSPERVTVNE